MKTCTKCQKELQDNEFAWKNKASKTKSSSCKSCNREYQRKHYINNKKDYINKAVKNKAKVSAENREKRRKYLLEHPCIDCGETDLVVLQFDHVRGKKRNIVANLVNDGYSWETVSIEIEKCEVRCANCHIRRHARVCSTGVG